MAVKEVDTVVNHAKPSHTAPRSGGPTHVNPPLTGRKHTSLGTMQL